MILYVELVPPIKGLRARKTINSRDGSTDPQSDVDTLSQTLAPSSGSFSEYTLGLVPDATIRMGTMLTKVF